MMAVSPREAYRVLATEYDTQPNALVSLEQRVMERLLPPLGGRKVIDCGAGTGRWAQYCAGRGAQAIAVDFSEEMLARCDTPAIAGDLRALPLRDACADITICAFAFGYSPGCLRELRRITRPGGLLFISDMHPEAVRGGWTRSFRHSSGVIHVAHEHYGLEDLHMRGIELSCLLEPRFGAPEHAIFDQAGHGDRFEAAKRHPAIFVARWLRV
jgi:ubiquinone/menaquinone biosynthesis C-methylase UbiE